MMMRREFLQAGVGGAASLLALQSGAFAAVNDDPLRVAIAFSSFVAFAESSVTSGLGAAISVGIASSLLLLLVTQPFALYPYSTCSTVRELVNSLVAINYTTLSTRYSRRNPSDIWNALQLIVCEQLGVNKREVVPEARFVQDLGAD